MTDTALSASTTIDSLYLEHLRDALGLGVSTPRISWAVTTGRAGWRQSGYELELSSGETPIRTGKIASSESVLLPWPFSPLRSRERVSLRVRVWAEDGAASAWSAPFAAEVGLLEPDDWTARFMTPDWDEDISRRSRRRCCAAPSRCAKSSGGRGSISARSASTRRV